MGKPRTLKIPIGLYGYHMEVDTLKADCDHEPPHWHFCHGSLKLGQIFIDGQWVKTPNIGLAIRQLAESYTKALGPAITETYNHNKTYGD